MNKKVIISIVLIAIIFLVVACLFAYCITTKHHKQYSSGYASGEKLIGEHDATYKWNRDRRNAEKQFFTEFGQNFSTIENDFVSISVSGREKYADSPIKDKINKEINAHAQDAYASGYVYQQEEDTDLLPFYYKAVVDAYIEYDGYTSVVITQSNYTGGTQSNNWTFAKVTNKKGRAISLARYIDGKITIENVIEQANQKIAVHPRESKIERITTLDGVKWALTETGDIQLIYYSKVSPNYIEVKAILDIDLK